MPDQRKTPEEFLAQLKEEKKESGKLKIFFGYAPGVGKTYAMLQAAHGHSVIRQFFHYFEDLSDKLRVKCAGGLVEEKNLWLHCERPCDRDALLLAAG